MIYLGIDPGATGAVAAITDDKQPLVISFEGLTERDIRDAIREAASLEFQSSLRTHALIEHIQPFPIRVGKPGKPAKQVWPKGVWKLLEDYGFLRGILVSLAIPHEDIAPREWQKALGCLSHGDKKIPHAKAQQLFPQTKIRRSDADAVLLAELCRRVHGGKA